MRVIIKATNIKLSESLKSFIIQKFRELEKFLEGILVIKAYVEVGKPSYHHQKGNVFYAEAQIPLPGKGVRSTAEGKDLRMVIVEVKDELQRLLEKYKKSQIQKTERAQRKIKKDLKLSPHARFYRKGRIREEGI